MFSCSVHFLDLQPIPLLIFTRNLTGTSFIFLSLKWKLFCIFGKDYTLVAFYIQFYIFAGNMNGKKSLLGHTSPQVLAYHACSVPIKYQNLYPRGSLQNNNKMLI